MFNMDIIKEEWSHKGKSAQGYKSHNSAHSALFTPTKLPISLKYYIGKITEIKLLRFEYVFATYSLCDLG